MPEAIIWGASGGIGAALVQTLKGAGWRVLAAARRVERVPTNADYTINFDASDEFSIKNAAMSLAIEANTPDLYVYAAGGIYADLSEQVQTVAWLQTLHANVSGALYTTRASLPLMREGAHLFYIGAYIDHLMLPKFGPYAAAKAALEAWVGVLAKEHRKHKFTVVPPGAVATDFWQDAPIRLPKDAKAPAIVAQAILDRYISGETGALNL
jgi:NAD(P)-dependent dehydrogenase (short-subunit alcohol dehydrogenase family)